MKRTGLFTKIFIYTFSIFSVLVICLHLAIYFLFPSAPSLFLNVHSCGYLITALPHFIDMETEGLGV